MHRAKSYQLKRSRAKTTAAFADQAPEGAELTEYDRQHLALYLRLLDATKEGAAWTEVAQILFGLDPNRDRDRALLVYNSHLARARWMVDHGYQDLLKSEKN
jgi:hypothetical protein